MDKSIFPETGMWEPMMDTTYKMDTEVGAKEAHLEQLDQCSECPKLTSNGGCLLAKRIIGLDLLVGIPKDDVEEFKTRLTPIMIRFKYENQPKESLQNRVRHRQSRDWHGRNDTTRAALDPRVTAQVVLGQCRSTCVAAEHRRPVRP
jgi:hypothetical protein